MFRLCSCATPCFLLFSKATRCLLQSLKPTIPKRGLAPSLRGACPPFGMGFLFGGIDMRLSIELIGRSCSFLPKRYPKSARMSLFRGDSMCLSVIHLDIERQCRTTGHLILCPYGVLFVSTVRRGKAAPCR